MALPSTLMANTSPIVDKALETGARGSTVTKTDYGVIGDAFFKKAQLDLNIASLKQDFGLKSAQIMSGLDMQKANLKQNEANIRFDVAHQDQQLAFQREQFNYQKQLQKEENELSDGEQIMGVLQGALGGVAAGAPFGPTGMVVGGVLGAGTTYAGGQSGGKRGQAAALGFTNLAASAVPQIKQYNDQRILKDAMSTNAQLVNQHRGVIEGLGYTQEEKDASLSAISNLKNETFQANLKAGVNPQQSWSAAEAMYDMGTSDTIHDTDMQKAGRAKLKQLSTQMHMEGREAKDKGSKLDVLKKYYPEFSAAFAAANGYNQHITKGQQEGAFKDAMGPSLAAIHFEASQNPQFADNNSGAVTTNIPKRGSVSAESIQQAPAPSNRTGNPVAPPVNVDNSRPIIETPQQQAGVNKPQARPAPDRFVPQGAAQASAGSPSREQKFASDLAVGSNLPIGIARPEDVQQPSASRPMPGVELDRPIQSEARVADMGGQAASQVDVDTRGNVRPVSQQQQPSRQPLRLTPREEKILAKGEEPGYREGNSRQVAADVSRGEFFPNIADKMNTAITGKSASERADILAQERKANLMKDPEYRAAFEKRQQIQQQEQEQENAASLDDYTEMKESVPPEVKPFFETTNSKEVEKILGADKVDKSALTMGERKDVANMVSTPARINTIKNDWITAGEEIKKLPPEVQRKLGIMYELKKHGAGGPNKDLAMEAKSMGIQVPGGGYTESHFKRDFSMQLKDAGFNDKETSRIMNKIDTVVQSTEKLSVKIATEDMKGTLTDKDLSIYMLRNIGHMNVANVMMKLHTSQEEMFETFSARMRWLPQKDDNMAALQRENANELSVHRRKKDMDMNQFMQKEQFKTQHKQQQQSNDYVPSYLIPLE